jgi:sulfite reductase alpha subunit
MGVTKYLTDRFISQLHRPELPYKYKFKLSGCANDCACSIQRSDMPVIGTWKGPMQIDHEEVGKFIDGHGVDYVVNNVITRCPTQAIKMKGARDIEVDNSDCVRCMHCINVMHKALRPGKERGATILIGGKRTLKIGDTMSSMIVPFMPLETKEDWDKLGDLVEKIWEFWGENGMEHERVGEFIERVGLGTFLEGVGIEPLAEMVIHPRTNPYIKFEELAPGRMGGEARKRPSVVDKEIETFEKAE